MSKGPKTIAKRNDNNNNSSWLKYFLEIIISENNNQKWSKETQTIRILLVRDDFWDES